MKELELQGWPGMRVQTHARGARKGHGKAGSFGTEIVRGHGRYRRSGTAGCACALGASSRRFQAMIECARTLRFKDRLSAPPEWASAHERDFWLSSRYGQVR